MSAFSPIPHLNSRRRLGCRKSSVGQRAVNEASNALRRQRAERAGARTNELRYAPPTGHRFCFFRSRLDRVHPWVGSVPEEKHLRLACLGCGSFTVWVGTGRVKQFGTHVHPSRKRTASRELVASSQRAEGDSTGRWRCEMQLIAGLSVSVCPCTASRRR